MDKVFFAGTHRVRHPRETLEIITPLFPRFGITRLADITGLDVVGIPTVMAVRPLSATLSVSQGKGADLISAKVSAAMEATEMWHAEQAVPAPVLIGVPAKELDDLGYRVNDLDLGGASLLTEDTPLDWVPARTAAVNRSVLVPRIAVHLHELPFEEWRQQLATPSTNGLASGNTRSEAVIHALYEVIERDCTRLVARVPTTERVHVDPTSVDDPFCAEAIDRIRRAKAWLEIVHVTNPWSLPCFVAYLWHEDLGSCLPVGSGVHSDPAVALSRAVTEAAQSRLTFIAGTRDDIEASIYRLPAGVFARPETPGDTVGWGEVTASFQQQFATDDDEAAWLADVVRARTDCEPVIVDLTSQPEFSVVKVFCPKVRSDRRHVIPRLAPEMTS